MNIYRRHMSTVALISTYDSGRQHAQDAHAPTLPTSINSGGAEFPARADQ